MYKTLTSKFLCKFTLALIHRLFFDVQILTQYLLSMCGFNKKKKSAYRDTCWTTDNHV